ncbi:DsbA family protein [Peptoniphilus catoniae]|uniref:DsbA family protein n=1 Tax=Peptoniphilus catoniae TaxID=1660341 RepID=UPI0010FDBC58|nr:DsbA family protein [Peptoniphilus catoniae]
MRIDIFSDAVCTWSYGEEKVLRAIDYIYKGQIEFVNTMGGLIADYRDILPMNMKDKDSDEMANKILLTIWKSGSDIHKMPIMNKTPKLLSRENPSTYFINRAFVTARLLDPKMANSYLRELRLATILYGRNTMDINVLVDIASKLGIDREDFRETFESESSEEFLSDRMKTFDRRLEAFPNFMYTDEKGKEYIIKGYKNKKELIDFIDRFSNLEKREVFLNRQNLLEFIDRYKKVYPAELVELFEDEEKINQLLKELEDEKLIIIEEIGTGKEIKRA